MARSSGSCRATSCVSRPPLRILTNNALLGGDGGAFTVAPAAVSVDGVRIVAVEAHPGVAAPGDVDLGDALLAPAFVNAHTHLSMSALRGIGGRASQRGNVIEDLYFRLETSLLPEDVRAFTRMGAWECLLSGTGFVLDHYYFGDAVAEALVDTGLSGVVAPTLQDLAGPAKGDFERTLATTEALATSDRLRARGIGAALGAHATDTVSDGLWRTALDLAEARDLLVHVHVAQSLEEVQRAIGVGTRSPVDRLRRAGVLDAQVRALLVHMLYVDDADLAALDPARHTIGYCPRSQVQFAFPGHVASWRAAGLDLVVGTDAGVCNDTMNVQLDVAWLAGAGLFEVTWGGALQAWRRGDTGPDAVDVARRAAFQRDEAHATSDALLATVLDRPGRLVGERVGAIAPGFLANLAAWDLDHPALWPATDPIRALCVNDVGPALHALWVAGREIGVRGDVADSIVRSPEYRAHREEATARLRDLRRRAGI